MTLEREAREAYEKGLAWDGRERRRVQEPILQPDRRRRLPEWLRRARAGEQHPTFYGGTRKTR